MELERNIQQRILALYKIKDDLVVVAEQESRLRHFRKSKLAILKTQCSVENDKWSNVKCEDYARSHPEYIEVCEGFAEATAKAEGYRWELKVAMQSMELLRTAEATKRAEMKNLGGLT